MKKVLRDIISFGIYLILLFLGKREGVVLLYHSVGYVTVDPFRLNITPQRFEKHLEIISSYGTKVSITFDDGYGNNYENAFPLLKKYGLGATIFLATDFLDGRMGPEKIAGSGFKARPLTWDEVRTMYAAGIKFGSHSKRHVRLPLLTDPDLKAELTGSKKKIEDMLMLQITSFAYPVGNSSSFDGRTRKAVMDAGYGHAYTNIMGANGPDPADAFDP